MKRPYCSVCVCVCFQCYCLEPVLLIFLTNVYYIAEVVDDPVIKVTKWCMLSDSAAAWPVLFHSDTKALDQ